MQDFTSTLSIVARGERELLITRQFSAPRELVFRAMTDAELVARWMTGPAGWQMVDSKAKVAPGGAFRHAWRHDDGREMAMVGEYREVDRPARIVRTECFEFGCEAQAGEQLATMTLVQVDGVTEVCVVVLYPSAEARDGALASGMEDGLAESYRMLDLQLATAALG
ncbi:SRPBCC domain-containing protein [Engelhardtia mirabilis]|uniref:Activator of Hsp90 ATPase homologue 1/2-like C-terminal domain-containing protein n=1 Tax=Engelhardtia mirabilis TaxID=2528011 RepID=A0A518BE01_9BACT|nr:hypothetical protein Pla133_02820 [Planctomycetes bacterium Pla133]QDU99544.1 hypothetical protein Pla86_02820 [Planctomycetes bacterium Pla86]